MKPITLGKNIEDLLSKILITRDEIDKIKDSIKNLASINIEIINKALEDISYTENLIETEYAKFINKFKTVVLEYNNFMDETEWNKSIKPKLNKYFTDKMNNFLEKYLSLIKICEDFFIELIENDHSINSSKYKLDRNPYFFDRKDISEKSKKVRENFSLPENIGFNWYSAKIQDEYLEVKTSLLMIQKIADYQNSSKLDGYLKGNTVNEILMHHPIYGTLHYISSGRNKDQSGFVDPEDQNPTLKIKIKNNDNFQGQYNEFRSSSFLNDINYSNTKTENYNFSEPDYLGLLRHYIEPEYESIEGNNDFIIKIKDNSSLRGLTPKNYQISRVNAKSSKTNSLLSEFVYNVPEKTENQISHEEHLLLSPHLDNTVNIETNEEYDGKLIPTAYLNDLNIIKDYLKDENETLVDYFPILNDKLKEKPINNYWEFINFQKDKVLYAANTFYMTEDSKINSHNIILFDLKDLKNNIIFYKKKGFGKYRDDYSLFRNWVLKVLPIMQEYTPIFDPKNLYDVINGHSSIYSNIKHIGQIINESPFQIVKDFIFDSLKFKSLHSFYSESSLFKKLLVGNYLVSTLEKNYPGNTGPILLSSYNYAEYFDITDNPNKYNNYFFTPEFNFEKTEDPLNKTYYDNIKGSYRKNYSRNLTVKNNKYPNIVKYEDNPNISMPSSKTDFMFTTEDWKDDSNGIVWFIAYDLSTENKIVILCYKYDENSVKEYKIEHTLADTDSEYYRSAFITENEEFCCISFKDKKVSIFKFDKERDSIVFSRRITLPFELLSAKDTSNSKVNWKACMWTNEIVYNSFDKKLYGIGKENNIIKLFVLNQKTFKIENKYNIPTDISQAYIGNSIENLCKTRGTSNTSLKQLKYFTDERMITHLNCNPYSGDIMFNVANTPELGFDSDTLYAEQPLFTFLLFEYNNKKFHLDDQGINGSYATSYHGENTKHRLDINIPLFYEKQLDHFYHYLMDYRFKNNVSDVKRIVHQNYAVTFGHWYSLDSSKIRESGVYFDSFHKGVFCTKKGNCLFCFDRFGSGNNMTDLYVINGSLADLNAFSNQNNKTSITGAIIEKKGWTSIFYSSKYNKIYLNEGTIVELEEGEIEEDNIVVNHSSRSLLNHTAISEQDEKDIVNSFFEDMDKKINEIEKMTIGTLKFIPFSPDNPEFLGKYAKAGTKLSKTDYSEIYQLIGDKYSTQYDSMEEGMFGLPVLYDRYLEYSNDSEEIGNIYEDQIADLKYEIKYTDKEITADDDKREGFISENIENNTSISLACGSYQGLNKKKIKINYKSTASITSGYDFRLDYYFKVK